MPFPFDPAPATLWSLTREDKLGACEIAFVPTGDRIANRNASFTRGHPVNAWLAPAG
jgi:hypothetical protein